MKQGVYSKLRTMLTSLPVECLTVGELAIILKVLDVHTTHISAGEIQRITERIKQYPDLTHSAKQLKAIEKEL